MNKNNSKNREFNQFSKLAPEWWDPNGKFQILHEILPLRMEYILSNINKNSIKNLDILDLGCGGGLTCEPLARLGANVTGIDFVQQNIEIAKKHAINSNLSINYINKDLDQIDFKHKYDVVLLLEVIEHLDNWQSLIKKVKKILKPKGKLIISTINKNFLSNLFAIQFAENLLKWVPKNTHHYNKLIKPENLKITILENKMLFLNLVGLNYNPIFRQWKLSDKSYSINYFCTAEKI